jgi:hypothetical protein
MTSAINPNNIDGAYPVAGQDNNSQGFRDNFTNIQTNFQYAANEITALQNNSVLTSDLATSTNPVVNNLLGSTLSNGYLQAMYEPRIALGTTSGSVTINYALGSYQTITTSGSVVLGFSNFPAAGRAASVVLQVTIASTNHTVQFPAAVSVNKTGIQGLDASTNIMSFATTGTYTFGFTTSDGGTTVSISQVNSQLTPFNASSEIISGNANASLSLTTSVFSITGNITANLSTGTSGQIKTFVAANIAGGKTALVKVTNAGWKNNNAGNISLTANGQGVTLQCVTVGTGTYDWFCIGNNGATFN